MENNVQFVGEGCTAFEKDLPQNDMERNEIWIGNKAIKRNKTNKGN